MIRTIHTAVLSLGLLACAFTARAQEVASAFESLQSMVKPGDAVIVTDAQGRDMRGRITALSPSSLAIDVDGTPREWRAGDVRLIRHRQRDSLVNGTLIGLGVGAGVGVLAAGQASLASNFTTSDDSGGDELALLLFGALGAGLGMGIDAAWRDDVVVFRAGGATTASLRVMPLVMPRAQGIRVAVVF